MALNELWRRTTPLDRMIVLLLLLLCVVLTLFLGLSGPGETLHVLRDNQIIFKADLETGRRVELAGPLGVSELEIRDGKARILSSPCPYKVCIGMGAISRAGEIIACVPNRLLIEVTGRAEPDKGQGYDLLSR
ncbi:MAG: hypothetical protein C0623_13355 [Desulfuromonas sp.]|nr:MAG: hypothetical protein C0623_13355 [Desulfuromonas sp.]